MSAKGIDASVVWTEHLPHFKKKKKDILKTGLCGTKLFNNHK